jgi:hypothetical protein
MTRKVFKWEKKGLLFSVEQQGLPNWMHEFAQAPNSLLLDDRIRFYFSTRTPKDDNNQYISQIGYVDFALDDLSKQIGFSSDPVLKLGGVGEFDEFGAYPFSPQIISNQVFAAYGGWTRCASVPFDVSIGIAKAELLKLIFHKMGNGPQLTKSLMEPFVIASPKLRHYKGEFYLFYIAGHTWTPENTIDPVYSIRMATSSDGENWTKRNTNIIPNILGTNEAQASPDVFYYCGYFHMFFSYRYGSDFRKLGRGYRMGYAYSDDLLNWHREDLLSDLVASAEGWDSESISYPHVFELNGDIYCAYLGNGIGRTGFGYAKLQGKSE